ncbi:MAG: MFS transporter [archaeon]|nr:MFS transporter [archaeon]
MDSNQSNNSSSNIFSFLPKYCFQTKKSKFISSVISGIILFSGMCTVMTIGNFSVYFLSDIHYKDSWVEIQYGNLIMPTLTFFMACFSPLAGIFEKVVGPYFSISIGNLIVIISLFVLYNYRSIYTLYTIMVFVGFGFGMCSSIPIKNACCFYPESKGLIASMMMSSITLIGAFFAVLGEKIINPNSMPVVDTLTEPYYSKEIAERSWNYLKIPLFLLPITCLTSQIFFIKYEGEIIPGNISGDNRKYGQVSENENGQVIEEESSNNSNNNTNSVNNSINSSSQIDPQLSSSFKENIIYAICHKRFWSIVAIVSLIPFLLLFISHSSRAYASLVGINPSFITFMPALMMVILCFVSPIWGYIYDKLKFKKVIRLLSFMILFLDIFFTLFIKINIMYVLGLIFSCIISAGMMTSINPHLMEIYGMEHYLIIGGVMGLFNGIKNIFTSGLSVIISVYFKTGEELQYSYRIVSFISIFLTLGGIYFALKEDDEKFNYPNNISKENMDLRTREMKRKEMTTLAEEEP